MAVTTQMQTQSKPLPDWTESIDPSTKCRTEEAQMSFVLNLLNKQVEAKTGGPFAAAIFDDQGNLVSIGVNQVVPWNDSTAHAEIVAIRRAQQLLRTFALNTGASSGNYTLVTTSQPCSQCCGAIPWAGLKKVIIGASARTTEENTGFDEGPIAPNWRGEYRDRGILVLEGKAEEPVANLLKQYKDQGGVIYNGQTDSIELASTPGVQERLVKEAADYIRQRIPNFPKTVIILGSGLGYFPDNNMFGKTVIPYSEIPNATETRTNGHSGQLVVGHFDGINVAALNGRVHYHDGASSNEVAFNARLMAELGVKNYIITNAAGGLREDLAVGDLMIIDNHISLLCQDPNLGLEPGEFGGDKFYPQTYPYSPECIKTANKVAQELRNSGNNLPIKQGTYFFVPGPKYESASDTKSLIALGADAVGMSTVPEVLTLKRILGDKAKIFGISVITNSAAGLNGIEPNHEEVKEAGRSAGANLSQFIRRYAQELYASGPI